MDPINTLQRLEQGHFIEKLAQEIVEMSEIVYVAGKGSKGKLTVTIDIERPKDAPDLGVVVRATFGRSEPKTGGLGAFFFTFEGSLHTADPRRPELPSFREVPATQAEERAVAERTAERQAQ